MSKIDHDSERLSRDVARCAEGDLRRVEEVHGQEHLDTRVCVCVSAAYAFHRIVVVGLGSCATAAGAMDNTKHAQYLPQTVAICGWDC